VLATVERRQGTKSGDDCRKATGDKGGGVARERERDKGETAKGTGAR
jgi:hypothetical protein